MIDLNPLVEERHPIKPPPNATAEEYHCIWYSLTDKVQYLPGGLASGKVTYTCCFHDLQNGLQTHCYAPMGLNIKGKWTLGGSLPGEPVPPVELGLGAPLTGLWLREDVDMKCNFMMTSFVKKTLQKAHSKLVDRLLVKAQIQDASIKNQELYSSQTSTEYSPSISESTSDDTNNSFSSGPYRNTTPITSNSSIGSFRPLELSHINENNTGLGLNPTTSSPPPCNRGSNISNRISYQDPQQSYNQRVSWQNLNPNPNPRSPSMHTIDVSYQQADQYRNPFPPPPQQQQMNYVAELHSEERVDAWRGSQNSMSPPRGPAKSTPSILEPGHLGGRQLAAHKGFPVELE
jgi:hypothetical protein